MSLLAGKICLVTGGGRGIGAATSAALAREGATVIAAYRSDRASADTTVANIRETGGRAEAMQLDVADPACAQQIEVLAERHGRLDVLVNNAAITRDGLFLSMGDDAWREVLATNLDGPMRCARAAARVMLQQGGGAIVNVSSGAARRPHKGQANYVASKGAVEALTRALAVELGPKNIRVNAVAPGFIRTAMSDGVLARREAELLAEIPLRRLGVPEEIADAVVFLASDLARFVHGHVLAVDGGRTLS